MFRLSRHSAVTILVSPLTSSSSTNWADFNAPLMTASLSPNLTSCRFSLSRRPFLTPMRLDSIAEIPELDINPDDNDGLNVSLNLGAESPKSILRDGTSPVSGEPQSSSSTGHSRSDDEWSRSGLAVHTNVPTRARNWRSNSFGEKQKKRPRLARETVDRDCGICFETAVSPSRTLCCGRLFCYEHICDWLHGTASDGRCPSCGTPCSVNTGVLSLATPVLRSPPSTPTDATPVSSLKTSTTTTHVNEFVEVKFARSAPLQLEVPSERFLNSRWKISPASFSGSSSPSTSTSSTVVGSAISDDCARLGEIFKSRDRSCTDTDELLLAETTKILRRKLQVEGRSSSLPCVTSDEGDDTSKGPVRRRNSEASHIYSPRALAATISDVIERNKTPTQSSCDASATKQKVYTGHQRRRQSISSRRSSRSSSASRSSTRTIQPVTVDSTQPELKVHLVGHVPFDGLERVLSLIGMIIVYYVLLT